MEIHKKSKIENSFTFEELSNGDVFEMQDDPIVYMKIQGQEMAGKIRFKEPKNSVNLETGETYHYNGDEECILKEDAVLCLNGMPEEEEK